MPTGTCRFPQHHSGPSAGPPIGLLLAIAAGALIIAEWRAVVVTLAVVAVLAVLAVCVVLLVHSHRSEPYDATWAGSEPGEVPQTVTAEVLQARVDQLERQLAERPAIEAPAQHLHLYGISAEDVAAIIARQQLPGGYTERP